MKKKTERIFYTLFPQNKVGIDYRVKHGNLVPAPVCFFAVLISGYVGVKGISVIEIKRIQRHAELNLCTAETCFKRLIVPAKRHGLFL